LKKIQISNFTKSVENVLQFFFIVLAFAFPKSYHILEFNPISAGVLENQDTLGGGQFDPPL